MSYPLLVLALLCAVQAAALDQVPSSTSGSIVSDASSHPRSLQEEDDNADTPSPEASEQAPRPASEANEEPPEEEGAEQDEGAAVASQSTHSPTRSFEAPCAPISQEGTSAASAPAPAPAPALAADEPEVMATIEDQAPPRTSAVPALPSPADERPPSFHRGQESAAPGRSQASVKWFVTNKERSTLRALGYSDTEVDQLQPERAAIILDRNIPRPSRGLPRHWTRSFTPPSPVGRLNAKMRMVSNSCKKAASSKVGRIVAVPVFAALWGASALMTRGSSGGGGGRASRMTAPRPVPSFEPSVPRSRPRPKLEFSQFWLDDIIDAITRQLSR